MTNQYKLSQILQIVQAGFEETFAEMNFRFIAEVSRINIVNHRGYCDLIELDASGKVAAKARGVIRDLSKLYIFLQKIKKTPDQIQSLEILVHGKVSFHAEYGFSIWIDAFSPEYTIGKIQNQKENIIAELSKLGILENNMKTSLGFPPYTVAIISSETSQGLQDFQTILDNCQYNFSYKLYPASIHGNEAKIQVLEQLQNIYRDIKAGQNIGLVAIVRGGGGSSGIVRQDDLHIAKGICLTPVPVMIAVGHTSDHYLLDQVAKFSAKTPSDAGRMLIDAMQSREGRVYDLDQNIQNIVRQKMTRLSQSLDFIIERINLLVRSRIEKISSNINFRHKYIIGMDIENLKHKGYAIVYDSHGNLMSRELSKKVKIGDFLTIKIYDEERKVEIESKPKRIII